MIAIERFLQQAVNQPSSAEVEQLVLHDMGTSTRTVYCVSLLNLQVVAVEAEHSKQVSWSHNSDTATLWLQKNPLCSPQP